MLVAASQLSVRHNCCGAPSPLLSMQQLPGGIVLNFYSPFDYLRDVQFCELCELELVCETQFCAETKLYMVEIASRIPGPGGPSWSRKSSINSHISDITNPILLSSLTYYSKQVFTLAVNVNYSKKFRSAGNSMFILSSNYLITNMHVNFISKANSMIYPYKLSVMLQLCAMLSPAGDIHPNPGPCYKYACCVCNKAVKYGQDGICCGHCNVWIHRE